MIIFKSVSFFYFPHLADSERTADITRISRALRFMLCSKYESIVDNAKVNVDFKIQIKNSWKNILFFIMNVTLITCIVVYSQ